MSGLIGYSRESVTITDIAFYGVQIHVVDAGYLGLLLADVIGSL